MADPAWTAERALALLEQQGALLQAGRGALPNLAEAIAGAPIRGSWWGHPRGKLIFAVLNELHESPDVLACKLLGKLTLVHRRLWPALYKLAGAAPRPGLDRVRQEHMPGGEHRNFVEPWPKWLPAEEKERASRLDAAQARAVLGPLGLLLP